MLTRPNCHLKDICNWGACDIRIRCGSLSYSLLVSILADCNTNMIHLAIVLGDTGVVWPNEGQNQFRNKMSTTKPKRIRARNILL